MDPYFQVAVLSQTENPQGLIWQAMHQDYSEQWVYNERVPQEKRAGELIVKHLLQGGRGHMGPFEHPCITFAVGYFPHSVMQQARTHRTGISFDCQSMRYTGKRICEVAKGETDVESVFYLRQPDFYSDRQGKKYFYKEEQRQEDLMYCVENAKRYARAIKEGLAEEHARSLICFDIRQHFVVSFNMRSLMHFLDLRAKADAQPEIHNLCLKFLPCFQEWSPAVAEWYEKNRLGKARLAP
jgi:thymidylate synthase (FAD)